VTTESDGHPTETKKSALVTVRVPGVTTVLGEFASYAQGNVLCCANHQNLFVTLSQSPDDQIHALNTLTNDRKKFSLSSLKFRREDKWVNYIKGVYLALVEKDIPVKPFDITLEGKLLLNDTGTLSAAVSVGVCLALRECLGFSMSDSEIALLCYSNCIGYCGEIAKYSTVITMLMAQKDSYMLFNIDALSFSLFQDPFAEGTCASIGIDCGIPPTAMREEIRLRHASVRSAFEKLREKYPRYSMKDFPMKDLMNRVIPLDEESRKICYAVMEDSAAARKIPLLPDKDYQQAGKILTWTSKLMRDNLEISCPEVDWMIKRTSEIPGCYGANLVFNGNNVYAAILIEKQAIPLLGPRFEEYEHIFGFKARSFVFSPCGHWEVCQLDKSN